MNPNAMNTLKGTRSEMDRAIVAREEIIRLIVEDSHWPRTVALIIEQTRLSRVMVRQALRNSFMKKQRVRFYSTASWVLEDFVRVYLQAPELWRQWMVGLLFAVLLDGLSRTDGQFHVQLDVNGKSTAQLRPQKPDDELVRRHAGWLWRRLLRNPPDPLDEILKEEPMISSPGAIANAIDRMTALLNETTVPDPR